jgi:hypothetical protein
MLQLKEVEVYSDFAGCEDTRRSTYGFGIFLGNDLYFRKSKLQNSVVLSSFEAEYIALSECTREYSYYFGNSIDSIFMHKFTYLS